MTREQAELIIKEEGLIETTWYELDKTLGYYGLGEYTMGIWLNPENHKYETFHTNEMSNPKGFHSFNTEKEAINDLIKENYRNKYFNRTEQHKEFLTKELALKVIKEENLEIIWYDEPLKPLCAGIKHDKQRDKYISFITDSKAEIIEWRSIEFNGDEEFEGEIFNDEYVALYTLINRARMIKQGKINFV